MCMQGGNVRSQSSLAAGNAKPKKKGGGNHTYPCVCVCMYVLYVCMLESVCEFMHMCVSVSE